MEKKLERQLSNILITGANGFLGRELCEFLNAKKYRINRVVRRQQDELTGKSGIKDYVVKDINGDTDWSEILIDIDVVIHLAARVHVVVDKAEDPQKEFNKTNVEGTENLAHQAQKAGVKRFIFLSTIKVNGEKTSAAPFTEKDAPAPQDFYSKSKYEAEKKLWDIAAESDLEVVIIRCPLVFGPHVKGNFLRLLQLVKSGIPLPLGSVKNKRSILSLYNLLDFLVKCIEHQAASGETFLLADGEDLSTPELIQKIALEMGQSPRIFSFPPVLLKKIGAITGYRAVIDRLCGSLQVDINKANKALGWHPVVTTEDGIAITVKWFLQRERR